MNNHTILITGGATGIGLAFAGRLVKQGNTVIVVGRREDKLAEARAKVPGLHTHVADVSTAEGRVALYEWAVEAFPTIDTLFNNAGLMRFPNFRETPEYSPIHEEIATNLEAPIHLTGLFVPHLAKQADAAILFTTSGLAFVPLAAASVYSATKAGLHSFALSLRHQLAETTIRVIEVAPPHVNTDLGVPGGNEAGMPLDEYADAALEQLNAGKLEITVGFSAASSQANRAEQEVLFAKLNGSPSANPAHSK